MVISVSVKAQGDINIERNTIFEYRAQNNLQSSAAYNLNNNNAQQKFPDPVSVLYKSMIIPGWGQIQNKQIWKVPIIYGLFAGIGAYTIFLHSEYSDYRAAAYNLQRGEDTDFKFGPTPDRLSGLGLNQLQSVRNSYRNQRDFMFIVMGLAYALNVIDAYVFAHMRSFDVSEDLSMNTTVAPVLLSDLSPGLSLSFSFNTK